MLPIGELVRVAELLDERHRCRLADRAADLWDAPGATFIRSSATHVFRSDPRADGSRVVLRMAPVGDPAAVLVARSAELAERLAQAGAAVAGSVRSSAGALVEEVDGLVVTAVRNVSGTSYDDDDLEPDTARAWGRSLAEFHRAASRVALPDLPGGENPSSADFPRDQSHYGVIHGDPEPDNLVFGSTGPVWVDLDDCGPGWFASDIGFALRAWSPPAGSPDLSAATPAAFLAGYREHRAVGEEELGRLPLLARASARRTLARLGPVLAEPVGPGWPDWAVTLHARVEQHAVGLTEGLRV
ncbi:MAG: phosphotransferase enzyme family protein [Nocardioides sp.]